MACRRRRPSRTSRSTSSSSDGWVARSDTYTVVIYFPKPALTSMFASKMERLGFFPTSYAVTGNQTHISSVAPLLRDLNPGCFSNWATATRATSPKLISPTNLGTATRVDCRPQKKREWKKPLLSFDWQLVEPWSVGFVTQDSEVEIRICWQWKKIVGHYLPEIRFVELDFL